MLMLLHEQSNQAGELRTKLQVHGRNPIVCPSRHRSGLFMQPSMDCRWREHPRF
uniref:Uncharacterized protein n=1 Tax=Arundo donax TaxID=35708 RepID=A0A0A9FS79_ARUDO